jgi:hypothetical protein
MRLYLTNFSFFHEAEGFLSVTLQKVSRLFAGVGSIRRLTLSLTMHCNILAAVLGLHHGTRWAETSLTAASAASATQGADFAT